MNRRNFIKVIAAAIVAAPFMDGAKPASAEQYGMAVGNDLANGDVALVIDGNDLANGRIAWMQGSHWHIDADGVVHHTEPFVRGELEASVFVADEVRLCSETVYIPAGTLHIVENHMQPVENAGQWRTLAEWQESSYL